MKKVLLKAFAIDEIEKFWAGGGEGGGEGLKVNDTDCDTEIIKLNRIGQIYSCALSKVSD